MSYPQNTWLNYETVGLPYNLTQTRSAEGANLLDNFKLHARVTGTAEDTAITRWLNRAVRDLEDDLATLLIIDTVTEYYHAWPWDWIPSVQLHRAPVASIDSIKYYDSDDVLQTWASSNYDTDLVAMPSSIVLSDTATTVSPNVDQRPNAVEIAYQAGLAATIATMDPRTLDAIFTRAAWLYGPGRELMPDVDPAAVERCWQHEISRLRWSL